jgi:nucleotide-binding universal stress UspA family protein
MEKHAREILTKYSEIAKAKSEVSVETTMEIGHPAKVILDLAKSKDVDLIAMGGRGMSGVKELFLDSVSHAVVRDSRVPVLVVK